MTGQFFVLDGYDPDKHVHLTFDFDGPAGALPRHPQVRPPGPWWMTAGAGVHRPRRARHDGRALPRVARRASRRRSAPHQGAAAGPGHRRGPGQHLRGRVPLPGRRAPPGRGPATWTATRCATCCARPSGVLRLAINHGGTTFLNFTNFHGKPGNFRRKLRVYGRAGEPCRRLRWADREAGGRGALDPLLRRLPAARAVIAQDRAMSRSD